MLDIVEADAKNVLSWPRDRRQQLYIGERQRGADRPIAFAVAREPFSGLPDAAGPRSMKASIDEWQRNSRMRADPFDVDNQVVDDNTEPSCGFDRGRDR